MKITSIQAAKELNISVRRIRALIDQGHLPAEKIGRDWIINQADLERVRERKPGRPKMRKTWIQDIIQFAPGHEMYIHRKEGGTQYDVYDPGDSQFTRLLSEAGLTEGDLLICPHAIRCGDSGCSVLDPFESLEAALEWIKINQNDFYFVKNTHPELKRRFPQIPVQLHPKEIENAFGINKK